MYSILTVFKPACTLLGTWTEEALEARCGAQALDAGQADRRVRKSIFTVFMLWLPWLCHVFMSLHANRPCVQDAMQYSLNNNCMYLVHTCSRNIETCRSPCTRFGLLFLIVDMSTVS